MPFRRRRFTPTTLLTSYTKSYSTANSQYLVMATPSFSGLALLTSVTDTERKNASNVRIKAHTAQLRLTAPVDTIFTYRIMLLKFTDRVDWDIELPVPLNIFQTAPTTTSFWYTEPSLLKDQVKAFQILSDKTVILDTHSGRAPLISLVKLRVPTTRVIYDTDDTDGRTARNSIVLLILTDATAASANHLYQLSYRTTFVINL